MTVPQLRKALAQHRLDSALSFEEIAARIGLDYITGMTVRRFVAGVGTPRDLTVHAIRQYIKAQKNGRAA